MKWFVTQDIANITQRLIDAGETVLSTPEMHRDPDDPDMEEHRDYRLKRIIDTLEEKPDVIFFGNLNQPPFYTRASALLFAKDKGKYIVGGNDNDPTGLFYNNNRMVKCTLSMRHLNIYVTNDVSVKAKCPKTMRVFDLNSDVSLLIEAVNDVDKNINIGKLYAEDS